MKNCKGKTFFVLVVFMVNFLFFTTFDKVVFAESGDGGDGRESPFLENKDLNEKKLRKSKTWVHPEKLSEEECGIQLYLRHEDIGLGTYTLYLKGALEGDMIVVADDGNCHVGDSNVIEFDDTRQALITILPKKADSKSFYFSGFFKTRAQSIPFFIAWERWGRKIRFVTGKEGLPDSW